MRLDFEYLGLLSNRIMLFDRDMRNSMDTEPGQGKELHDHYRDSPILPTDERIEWASSEW